ncbi:glycosyltransferase family 1 protein [Novosphingobium sp. BL-8H]|uniref:glycosyltransferase family 4 protein n=1 Tax=Novosphingobium sp. BL-8H TaxID=3127640 RepID=UPI0037569E14
MRVVINGRFLDKATTGVERYAREIVRAIDGLVAANDPQVRGMDFVVARPPSGAAAFTSAIAEVRAGPSRGVVWEQTTLPRIAGRAAILNLCNMAPLLGRAQVTCVHDAHPWLMPENFSAAFRRWYDVMIPLVLRRSARWTTVSEFSAQKLQDLNIARRPPDAITYNAADNFATIAPESLDGLPDAVRGPFVLCLGSQSANKNIGLIAGLADELRAHGIAVVVAGGGISSIFGARHGYGSGVIDLGRVSDGQLKALYAQALAFVFPSFFEGFGVPAVEAMQMACPAIVSNTSALPEVVGDAAILADPTDARQWLEAILRIRDEPGLREELVRKGHERAARYSWERSARTMVALLKDAAA